MPNWNDNTLLTLIQQVCAGVDGVIQQGLSYPQSVPQGYSLLKRQTLEIIMEIINESLVECILQGKVQGYKRTGKGRGSVLFIIPLSQLRTRENIFNNKPI